jgi:hypothetical protein
MKPFRLLLAATATLCVLAVSAPAGAQVPTLTLGSAGSVTLIPPGEITTDGKRISLLIMATDESGSPATGVRFSGSSTSRGRLDSDCRQVGPGLYDCAYTTPQGAGGAVQLRLQARLPSGNTLNATYPLTLVQRARARVTFTAQPAQILLTEDPRAALTLTVVDASGQAMDGIALRATANVGTVDQVAALSGGRYSAVYTPPPTPFPQIAIISIWDATDPDRTFGFFTIPLIGKVDYPVDAQAPGVELTFTVGGTTFPPVTSGADGVARVPITVAPGVTSATVTLVAPGGSSQTQKLDLMVPPFNRIALGATPTFVPADGKHQTKVRVFAVDSRGRPADGQQIAISATSGNVGAVRFVGNGLYEAVFTAPLLDTPSRTTISASIVGKEMESNDTLELVLEAGGPASLSLTADPAQITPSISKSLITARVLDPSGSPIGGHNVEIRTATGPVTNPRVVSPGVFSAELPVQWNVKTRVQAIVAMRGNRQPVDALVALPLADQVLTGQGMPITVVSVDVYGNPVAGAALNARVLTGGGSVTPSVQTDSYGLGTVLYTAGALPSTAVIEFSSGSIITRVPLWQGNKAVKNFSFPISGGQKPGRLQAKWRKLRGRLTFGQTESSTVADAGAATSPWGASPPDTSDVSQDLGSATVAGLATSIQVSSIPTSVPETGGSVNLLVRVVDGNGLLVPGENIILLADAGTISNKVDNGDGTFSAVLVVPPDTGKRSVQVTATRVQGDIAAFASVGIGGPIVVPPPVTRKKRPQPVAGDARLAHRRAQVMIGWTPGFYTYNSHPCEDRDPAVPCEPASDAVLDSHDFLRAEVAAPITGSFAIEGEFFPIEFAGVHASYNRMAYQTNFGIGSTTVQADESIPYCERFFCDSMNVFNIDFQARVPLFKSVGPLDIMPRVGYQVQDLVVFRRVVVTSVDPDTGEETTSKQPQFQTMTLHGLRVGVGVRFTVIPQIRPHVNYDISFGIRGQLVDDDFPISNITNHQLVAGVGIVPWKGLLIDLSYGLFTRGIGSFGWVVSEDGANVVHRGAIAEVAHTFRLSAGWAF